GPDTSDNQSTWDYRGLVPGGCRAAFTASAGDRPRRGVGPDPGRASLGKNISPAAQRRLVGLVGREQFFRGHSHSGRERHERSTAGVLPREMVAVSEPLIRE